MPRALISVSDKRGVVAFAQGLAQLGWEIISTGGTAAALRAAGVPVTPVDEVTGFPELLDGRVKTLHPAIHGALLARRDLPEHLAALDEHGIAPIDLVAVNLYPFQMTVAQPGVAFADAVENIDIGGPSMLRSAAKNHEFVLPVVDPTDYPQVLHLLRAAMGSLPRSARSSRPRSSPTPRTTTPRSPAILTPPEDGLPRRLGIAMERVQALRYGENPGQRAALYVTEEPRGMRDLTQRQGKELSFNNLLDIDAAMWAVACWSNRPACSVIKHTTPCGIAVGGSASEAFRRARATDPVSAFGSVVAFNTVVDRATAQAMSDLFVEVVVAPSFHEEALAVFAAKKSLRVVELPVSRGPGSLDFKRVRGGFLVQDQFQFDPSDQDWTVATDRQPTEREWNDLRFAWAAVASVKSNADPARPRRGGHRDRRRPDEPGGQRLPRGPQGAPTGPRSRRQRARLRRLLPLRRRRRAGRRRRRHRDHPARRLGSGRRSDRGRQPPRHGHGDDRPPPVPTLAHGPHDPLRRRSARRTSGRSARPSSSSLIYLVTLAPTTAFWDTSEYIAAAKVLGIPHPPGNPLFTILAHTFGLLPLAAVVRGADQPLRGGHQRRRGRILVPRGRALAARDRADALGALRRGVRRRAGGRHLVERLEPVAR